MITVPTRSGPGRPWTRAAAIAVTAAICAAVAHGYSLKSYKWARSQVSFYVNPANQDVSEGEADAAVRAGANTWGLQSSANFEFVYAGRTTGATVAANGRNEVFFRNEANGGTIATTYWWADGGGKLVEADIKFYDGGFRFFTGTSCVSGQFIEDIAAHEFGHALGMNHSSVADATMYSTSKSCQSSWRTLSSDDIAGVEKLYPPSSLAPAPSAPTNLSAARNGTYPASAINVSWTDTSSNEERFLVERSGDGATFAQVASLAANTCAYTDSGLTSGRTYTYRVRASNSGGFSSYSNLASATTASTTTAAPGTPTSPSPGNGATGVSLDADLRWSATGATSYDVYFGTASTPPLYRSGLTAASLNLPRLSSATTYYWRVVAKNTAGSTSGSTWRFTTRTKGNNSKG